MVDPNDRISKIVSIGNEVGRLITLAILALPLSLAAQERPNLALIEKTLANEIDVIREETGIPSITITLFTNDSIVWNQGFGYSNIESKIPATTSTIYSTGSCFKPVTSMAIMQLAEQGKLSLDDPAQNYLEKQLVPTIYQHGQPITIRHLLSHFSGVTGPTEFIPFSETSPVKSLTEIALTATVEESPGVNYSYSNVGYAIAGLIIEKVSGQSYGEYISNNILKPLGITDAHFIDPNPDLSGNNMATPYRLENKKAHAIGVYRSGLYPAGDVYLCTPAMAKILLTFLNNGRCENKVLLHESSVKEMRKPQFGGNTALDFGIREFNGEKFLEHGGNIPGYTSKFILGIDSKVGVYVTSNASWVNMPLNVIAQLAIDLLMGKTIGTGLVREIAGVGLGLEKDSNSGTIRISNIVPGSPAGAHGLSSGLQIEKINDVTVGDLTVEDCLQLMKGPEGTKVQLVVLNPQNNQLETIDIIKQKFLVPG